MLGLEEVEAHDTGIPGLVWHKAIGCKGYTITHVQSGYAVIREIPKRDGLKQAIERLKELPIDWTLCRTKIKRVARTHAPTIVRIASEVK